ncbi:hypothetical protein KIW84_065730 [Lathyrus oleraceus]|uniref:Arabidopsis retrotransposon Orf1 C-terminal domain-containing protein n=1 Tax=Pisum sativum TaxID=3888 RepID=A0A9D5A7T7_PEA|nr:hypothetical protein KIW84_065730 [Pisum sativum]
MGITSAEGIVGENQRSNYHKLFKRNVLATRYPDNATLHDLGLIETVNWMLSNLDMSYSCSLTSAIYNRLTYEFLCSFRYSTPVGVSRTTCTVYFRMFNKDYTFSQGHMANIFSFPHGDEYACQAPLEREWEANALDFWRLLTGKTTSDWEGLKATAIQNPTIRYLHRILAKTIFGRENNGNLNSRDLFLIFCALSATKVNPTSFLLVHLQSISVRIGDLDNYRSMHLIKNKPDDKYYLMISNREVRGVNLPCAACINMRLRANWVLDANAPDPDDTIRSDYREQDAPQTGTHAYSTHAFLDFFAGTSSGYQPHEEYDYTSMRTAFDDILSELRHQNDVDEYRDMLLRSIQR